MNQARGCTDQYRVIMLQFCSGAQTAESLGFKIAASTVGLLLASPTWASQLGTPFDSKHCLCRAFAGLSACHSSLPLSLPFLTTVKFGWPFCKLAAPVLRSGAATTLQDSMPRGFIVVITAVLKQPTFAGKTTLGRTGAHDVKHLQLRSDVEDRIR